jgi:small subunit ribosomal protein S2
MDTNEIKAAAQPVSESLVRAMFEVGAHYGYTRTRRHPTTKAFLYGTKNRTDLIDLEKTAVSLATAEEVMATLGTTGKQILFVGTKPEAKDAVKSAANALGMPYVEIRWIGGTLTNEKQIKSRVTLLEEKLISCSDDSADFRR